MTAERVRPDAGPGLLVEGATGDQNASLIIEDMARECEMQCCIGTVEAGLRGSSDLVSRLIEEDNVVGVGHVRAPLLIR